MKYEEPWKDLTYKYFEEDLFIKYVLEYCNDYGFKKEYIKELKDILNKNKGETTYKILMRDCSIIQKQNHIKEMFYIPGQFMLYSYFDPIGSRSYLIAVFDEKLEEEN